MLRREEKQTRMKRLGKAGYPMEQKIWGKTKAGEDIIVYSLQEKSGSLRAAVMNYGATLLSVVVTDKNGREKDVVLGHETAADYFDSPTYYGMTVARCANRIGGAQFSLNKKTYHTDKNDGNNTNHSGFDPLCRRVWQTCETGEDMVAFSYDSPDGDMGFPGNMHIDVTYTLKDGAIIVDYHAKSDADTIFNPTNHSYYNLKGHGEGDILDHSMIIYADEMTYANEESVPDGTIRSVAGTPFDFREEKKIGLEIDADYDMTKFGRGYDHNYILRKDTDAASEKFGIYGARVTDDSSEGAVRNAGECLSHAATLIAPDRSVTLDVYTDLPGVQIYTGNYIADGSAGKNGKKYVRRGGVAIETQYYPNAMNIPAFVQPVIKADEDFYSRSVYLFSI